MVWFIFMVWFSMISYWSLSGEIGNGSMSFFFNVFIGPLFWNMDVGDMKLFEQI